jgi:hypothetical protein
MIRWRVCDVVERLARDRDYMLLANLERVRGFDTERKALHRPAEHSLPNLTPLWPNRNFGAYRSNFVAVGILKRDVNVAVGFRFFSRSHDDVIRVYDEAGDAVGFLSVI